MQVFVAVTDKAWFDFLSQSSFAAGLEGRLDEVNFWSPSSMRPLKKLEKGEPFFLRLKSPHNAIAGYGFFAHFTVLELDQAWQWFEHKNGDPNEVRFLERIGKYRHVDLLDPTSPRAPIGCTILRDVCFWPKQRWIPWGPEVGWKGTIVRGRGESDPVLVARLLAEIRADHQATPDDLSEAFQLMDADQRRVRLARTKPRSGQGAFRARLFDAYGRCAITGEHTQVVLDAAHIQSYLGPGSNHVQNGLLLTKEFHTLFDRGYVTVTPDFAVRVSGRLRRDYDNGKRYYPYDGQALEVLPDVVRERPSQEALEWHGTNVFLD